MMTITKTLMLTCLMLLCACGAPLYAEILISSGVRCDLFVDDQDPESTGVEVTLPFGLAYKQERYSISLESAYLSATVEPGDEDRASVANLTDMLLSATYSYNFSNRPMGAVIGLDLNLPTGAATLSEQQKAAQAGESNDLFEVDNFGDGFNVGLSLALIHDIGNLSLALQNAYVITGEYDPTSDTEDDTLNPGDQFLALALAGWQASPRLTLDAFLAYSRFGADTTDGHKNFRAGDTVVGGGNIRYDRNPLNVALSLQGTVQAKNQELRDDALSTESQNSNANKMFVLTNVTYTAFSPLILRAIGDIRYYAESELRNEINGLPFAGQRIRYAIGPGFVYHISNRLSCDGLLKVFAMTEDAELSHEEAIGYQGLNFDIGFTYTF